MGWRSIEAAPHGIWLWARNDDGEFKAIWSGGSWQVDRPGLGNAPPTEWLEGWRNLPLKANWSKRERDVMIHYPRSPDGHWLAGVFDKSFVDELDRRGYDVTTLRFSVKSKAIEAKR
jgi:hypothetical protein